MKKTMLFLSLMLYASISFSQSLQNSKVVFVSDTIKEMGRTNGRMQTLITAPVSSTSIIVQSIDIRNQVLSRLYSPESSQAHYVIGYQKGAYWYDVATISFDDLNSKGNTTFFNSATIVNRLWEESQTDGAALMIKFDKPMNFTTGYNRLTIFITYRILN